VRRILVIDRRFRPRPSGASLPCHRQPSTAGRIVRKQGVTFRPSGRSSDDSRLVIFNPIKLFLSLALNMP
jgi:hypothetical protein